MLASPDLRRYYRACPINCVQKGVVPRGAPFPHRVLARVRAYWYLSRAFFSARIGWLFACGLGFLPSCQQRSSASPALHAFGQSSAQTPVQSPLTNAVLVQATVIAVPANPARVVQFLDQTIAWYQQLGAQQRLVSDANDEVYVSADRQMANEVVRLAFQYARSQAEATQPTGDSAQQASGQGRRPVYVSNADTAGGRGTEGRESSCRRSRRLAEEDRHSVKETEATAGSPVGGDASGSRFGESPRGSDTAT